MQGVDFVDCNCMFPHYLDRVSWAAEHNFLESFDEGLGKLSILLPCGQGHLHGDLRVVFEELGQEKHL